MTSVTPVDGEKHTTGAYMSQVKAVIIKKLLSYKDAEEFLKEISDK